MRCGRARWWWRGKEGGEGPIQGERELQEGYERKRRKQPSPRKVDRKGAAQGRQVDRKPRKVDRKPPRQVDCKGVPQAAAPG